MSRMSRADRREWEQACTLAELGELTARWLEGDIASQPGCMSNLGPDSETTELIPTLAACNRAGYVTVDSQPGEAPGLGYDGRLWSQRAAVSGFADDATAARILAAVEDTGQLVIIAHDTPPRRWWCSRPWRLPSMGMAVTASGDRVSTELGGRMSLGDLEDCFAELGQDGFAAVHDALQVTVIDPVWGRNNVLWSVLDDVVDPSGVAA